MRAAQQLAIGDRQIGLAGMLKSNGNRSASPRKAIEVFGKMSSFGLRDWIKFAN